MTLPSLLQIRSPLPVPTFLLSGCIFPFSFSSRLRFLRSAASDRANASHMINYTFRMSRKYSRVMDALFTHSAICTNHEKPAESATRLDPSLYRPFGSKLAVFWIFFCTLFFVLLQNTRRFAKVLENVSLFASPHLKRLPLHLNPGSYLFN